MSSKVVNIEELHKELGLSDQQKELLCDALESLYGKYNGMGFNTSSVHSSVYFEGISEGFNSARKLVMGTDDDYNSSHE